MDERLMDYREFGHLTDIFGIVRGVTKGRQKGNGFKVQACLLYSVEFKFIFSSTSQLARKASMGKRRMVSGCRLRR